MTADFGPCIFLTPWFFDPRVFLTSPVFFWLRDFLTPESFYSLIFHCNNMLFNMLYYVFLIYMNYMN